MLGKLMKYEFKALLKDLGPLYAAWLLMEILIVAFLKSLSTVIPNFILFLFMLVFIVMSVAVVVMTVVVILDRRFYKNFYGDEGYFTLSLPVKVSTHIWNKVITTTIWLIAAGFISSLALILSLIFGLNPSLLDPEIWHRIIQFVKENNMETMKLVLLLVELLILSAVSISKSVLHFLFSINIGAQFSRYKGMMMGIAFVGISIFEIFVLRVFGENYPHDILAVNTHANNSSYVFVGMLIAFQLVLAGIYFIGTHYFMNKRFNLE